MQAALIRSGQGGDGVVTSLNFTSLTFPTVHDKNAEVEESELIVMPDYVETTTTKSMSLFTDLNWDHLSTNIHIERITMDIVSNRILQLAAALLNTNGSRLYHLGVNGVYDDSRSTLDVVRTPGWSSQDMCKNVWEKLTSVAFPFYVLNSMNNVVFKNVTSLRIIFSQYNNEPRDQHNLHVQFPSLQHLEIHHCTSGPNDYQVSLLDAVPFPQLRSMTINIGNRDYRSGHRVSMMRRFKKAYQEYCTLTAVREEIQQLSKLYLQLTKKGVLTADDINTLIGEAQMIRPCDHLEPYYPLTVYIYIHNAFTCHCILLLFFLTGRIG